MCKVHINERRTKMKIEFRTPEAADGSIKYRFRTDDNRCTEALYFPYNNGLKVLCLSTQIGCDMGCYFCCSGKQKKIRNLSKEEIVQQATLIVDDLMPGQSPDTITLAGMGEPLANYEASIGALEEFEIMFGPIRLSLSTVGLKEGIKRMIAEKRHFGLYLSLHSADEHIRQKLMPAAARNSTKELISLLKEYAQLNPPGTVRISYLLLRSLTDGESQLQQLIELTKNSPFQVQFRLWNYVEGIDLQGCSFDEAQKWVDRLQEEGINACIRPSLGQEVQGACGQIHFSEHHHKIIPIISFSEAEPYLDSLDQKTLVIFDIDSTLIVPKDPLLHPKAFSAYKEVLRELFLSISADQKHFLNHSIIAHPAMAVEGCSVSFIKQLQDRQIPTIALTAAKQGTFDAEGRKFHTVREQQLDTLGIDFSRCLYPDRVFSSLQATYDDYPTLKNGIIYSCGLHNTKGMVLETFMNEIANIERVVLFDDKRKHLESVAAMLRNKFPNCEFLGFHYKGADFLHQEEHVSKEEFEKNLRLLIAQVQRLEWVQ